MRYAGLTLLSLLLVAPAATAHRFHCDHTAPHQLTAAMNGATSVVVIGRAGSLRITGGSQGSVAATGTACSSDRDFLQSMRIEARRDGSELVIEAIIPERTTVFGFHNAALDLEVVVPDNVPVRVKDGSGEMDITGVASLDVKDGSGEIRIRDVRGDVEVYDGSGEISIEDVLGSVRIAADGSGGIEIRDVRQNVIVERDGSGSIEVSNVRGNFTVESDGSGGVDYDGVAGSVNIPSRKR